MIEVTVKTLDARNHLFTVSEEFSVREFKEEISGTVSIPAAEQRLIFRGRVLQDDKKMSEYNVANNTIHLVQRPTQSGGSTQNDEPPRNTGNADDRFNLEGGGGGIIITAGTNPTDRNAIIMGTIGIPTIDIPVSEQSVNATGVRRNSAALRLQTGNEMVNKASNLLQRLEEDDETALAALEARLLRESDSSASTTPDSDQPTHEPGGMELDPEDPASFSRMLSQVANAASQAAVLNSVRAFQNQSGQPGAPGAAANAQGERPTPDPGNNNSQNATGGAAATSESSANNRRVEAPRLRDMAIALQDLLAFNERLTPFLHYIQTVLRDNRTYTTEMGELRCIQYTFDTLSQVLHYLGHSYHAFSDLMCDFSVAPENRRISAPATILVEQSTVVRATIPIAVPTFGPAPNLGQPAQPPQQNQNPQAPGAQGTPSVPPASQNVPQAPPTTVQFPNFPGMNITGQANPGVNMPHNHGAPGFSINIQSNGMPDLAAILGPALAGAAAGGGAGMLPFLSLGGLQANLRNQQPNQAQAQNQNNPSGQNPLQRPNNNTFGGTGIPPHNNPNTMANAAALSARNEPRHVFDLLLQCHSHHANRLHDRQRPGNLQTHINMVRNFVSATARTSSIPDWIEGLVDILRYSTWLEVLQPHMKDIVQNYLMRGRDIKNPQHIKTCAKGLARKLAAFFKSFNALINTKNDNVEIQQTFNEYTSKFFCQLLNLVVNSGPTKQFRSAVMLLLEDSIANLFSIFRICFPNNKRVPDMFARALVDEYLAGMSINFRNYTANRLGEYFNFLANLAEANNLSPEAAGVVVTPNPVPVVSLESSIPPANSAAVAPSSTTVLVSDDVATVLAAACGSSAPAPAKKVPSPEPLPSTSKSSVPIKTVVPQPAEAMDTDIDDLIDNIPAPFSPSQRPPASSNPLDDLPSEWRETIQHDIRRQLGMPEQPPPSPGLSVLFPRRQ